MDLSTPTRFRVTKQIATPIEKKVLDAKQPQSYKYLSLFQKLNCGRILQSTPFQEGSVTTERNGLLDAVLHCYNNHKNLVLRPDDVWVAIMTQFSFYVNNNAEKLRNQFVDFKGKKTLTVDMGFGTIDTIQYDQFVKAMTKTIDLNLVDTTVKEWILPAFSTTRDNDVVSCGVVFMATMKKYFEYVCMYTMCGIPEIILEGSVSDWVEIDKRLDKLKEYEGLSKWRKELKKILLQFINAKKGKPKTKFWGRICEYKYYNKGWGSGSIHKTFLTGWITAFCAFDEDGNPLNCKKLEIQNIPLGYVQVDVTLKETSTGDETPTVMFAGHVGMEWKEEGCTLQPSVGWAIALKGDPHGRFEDYVENVN